MKRFALAVAAVMLFAIPTGCGSDDDDEGTSVAESTTEVTLTADDISETEKTFELSATPTAETKSVTFKNEGDEVHAMVFARINEGFTVDEAFELEGRKGSAEVVAPENVGAKPGKQVTVDVKGPLEPGSYAMLCPIPNSEGTPHYKLGQLEEFEIQ
jgi:uncharacterized cupredoxin-like copper-binding protein